MTDRSKISVFVSYSHADSSLVTPVVGLLRANQSLVFQDTDRIRPGKKWRDEIATAINQSNFVVVFWCHHSSQSKEVMAEWQAALEQGKDLLPLLLDKTPLPEELQAYQWIDFRGTVGAQHESVARKYLRCVLIAVAFVALFLVILIWATRPLFQIDYPDDIDALYSFTALLFFLVNRLMLILGPLVFLAIAIKIGSHSSFYKRIRCRRINMKASKKPSVRHIAKTLETELQVRTGINID